MQIVINNAEITAEDGTVTKATITGDAEMQEESGGQPAHPILTPPEAPEGSFYVLSFCPNPPPPHWEWILFTPGSPPERPKPQPPEPPETIPGGEKPFPPSGGWGYKEPYGWIYWPGPGGAGPKRR